MPEPEPREVRYTIISVDDHLSEPPHMFEGRLPKTEYRLAPAGRQALERYLEYMEALIHATRRS